MGTMVRKHFYLTEEQIQALQSLGGTLAEHIRRAIDDYLAKMQKVNVSASSSRGGLNGRSTDVPSAEEE
jgi:Tfp pilus assembly PilM family ATPase